VLVNEWIGAIVVEAVGKKKSIIIIVVMVVFGLLLAGGVSYFIANKIVADSHSPEGKVVKHEPGVMMRVGDAKDGLIVNIGKPGSGHFLKIGLFLELKPDKKETSKEGKAQSPDEIKILDAVTYVLRSRSIEDYDITKQEELKEIIKNEVNKVLGEERVYSVYITTFLLQ